MFLATLHPVDKMVQSSFKRVALNVITLEHVVLSFASDNLELEDLFFRRKALHLSIPTSYFIFDLCPDRFRAHVTIVKLCELTLHSSLHQRAARKPRKELLLAQELLCQRQIQ
jgi:hypothetical protein